MNRTVRILLTVLGVIVAVAVVAGIAVYIYLLNLFERLDNTAEHGDQCLAEKQGENFRCWDLLVPEGLGDEPVPLVIDIPGFYNSTETQRGYGAVDVLAQEEKFIAVWPHGINNSWNAGGEPWPVQDTPPEEKGQGCCGLALFEGSDDVSFILKMVAQLQQEHNIDKNQIFLTGFSNGCGLAQRLAAEASAVFAGVGCMSMVGLVEPAPDYSPIPIIVVQGTEDSVVAYEGESWISAMENFEAWKARNNCTGPVEEIWREGEHNMIQASGCTNDASVALVTIVGSDHIAYKGHHAEEVDTLRMAWDFLLAQTAQ
ncbi:MAG: PHB depolymerase family esterase [Chloroflexota bacterium]